MTGGLIDELKRRHVFRAAAVYPLVAPVVLRLAESVVPSREQAA